MGFTNREANLEGSRRNCARREKRTIDVVVLALTATMGNVNAAVERLLGQI
jgi:hypothetical protein